MVICDVFRDDFSGGGGCDAGIVTDNAGEKHSKDEQITIESESQRIH